MNEFRHMPREQSSSRETEMQITRKDAIKLLTEVYEKRDIQPEIADFSIHAGEHAADQAYVEHLLNEFERNRRKVHLEDGELVSHFEIGNILESMMSTEIDRSDWLGGLVFRTTKFDDYHNGVDAVLEWDLADELGFVPRLGIDITSSTKEKTVSGKLQTARTGRRVKYFRSQVEFEGDEEKEMSLENLPMIVLGIDYTYIKSLGKTAFKHMREKRNGRDIDPRTFQDHKLKILLLEQARAQVDAHVRLAAPKLMREIAKIDAPEAQEAIAAYRDLVAGNRITPHAVAYVLDSVRTLLLERRKDVEEDQQQQNTFNILTRGLSVLAIKHELDSRYAEIQNADLDRAEAWRRGSHTNQLLTRAA